MIENLFSSLLPSIEHFRMVGYWLAFFAAFLETVLVVGLVLPGSTFLLLLGAASARGYLDFGDLLWFAIAGAVMGDNLNYWIGHRYGSKWNRTGIWFITAEHIAQVRRFFDRHGAKSVLLARFLPSVKELAPFIAGTVGMPRRTFMFWNVLGGIGWGLQWTGCGYLFGQSLKMAQAWVSRSGLVIMGFLLVVGLVWLLQRFILRNGRAVLADISLQYRAFKAALSKHRYTQHVIQKHPDSVQFLATRFNRSHFYGLPLTMLVLAFLYVLALFAGVVEDVVTSDAIIGIDHATAKFMFAIRSPELLAPFLWITRLGEPIVVGGLLCVLAVVCWLANHRYLIVGALVSTLGASTFTMLSKLLFHRPRPLDAFVQEASFSFPSGHATSAVAFYGFVGYLLIRSTTNWQTRVNILLSTLLLILLIGLSRMVLGVHYLSDIWAGYLVGALWLILGISLTEWLCAIGKINWQAPCKRHK